MTDHNYRRSVLEAVVETVPDGILVVDEDRQFFTYNQQFVDMWGITEGVVESGDDQRALESVLAALERPEEFLETVEYYYDNPYEVGHDAIHLSDGRIFDRYTAPALDDTGRYYGRIWVFEDITERTTYEDRLRALNEVTRRLMSATTPADVADITVDGVTDVLDQHLTAIWRYDADEKQLLPLAATDVAAAVDESGAAPGDLGPIPAGTTEMRVFREGEPTVIEDYQQAERPGHQETALRTLMMVPLAEYGQLHVGSRTVEEFDATTRELVTVLARNVTSAFGRVEHEQALRERERDLEQQNERLEEFASIVSHDLRNPLSVAQGNLTLARADCDTPRHDPIERALDRMEGLIDDLLMLARHGKTVDEVEPMDLTALLERCWQTVDTAEATLNVERDLAVRADRGRLRQLLENLLRNAVEHGGETVTITVGSLPTGFYLADDGPGIQPERRETVFESNYSTSEDGAGYGLAIVDRVVEAHGWNVTVAESETGGTRFEITGVERCSP